MGISWNGGTENEWFLKKGSKGKSHRLKWWLGVPRHDIGNHHMYVFYEREIRLVTTGIVMVVIFHVLWIHWDRTWQDTISIVLLGKTVTKSIGLIMLCSQFCGVKPHKYHLGVLIGIFEGEMYPPGGHTARWECVQMNTEVDNWWNFPPSLSTCKCMYKECTKNINEKYSRFCVSELQKAYHPAIAGKMGMKNTMGTAHCWANSCDSQKKETLWR